MKIHSLPGRKKEPLPSCSKYNPLPICFTRNPSLQMKLHLLISLVPKPIFCKSGASKVSNIGTFPTKSDTTPVPDFNCCSIASLCLFCSAFDFAAETADAIPPVKPPTPQEFQQLMELMAEI